MSSKELYKRMNTPRISGVIYSHEEKEMTEDLQFELRNEVDIEMSGEPREGWIDWDKEDFFGPLDFNS